MALGPLEFSGQPGQRPDGRQSAAVHSGVRMMMNFWTTAVLTVGVVVA